MAADFGVSCGHTEYSNIERPQSIVRRTHQHGPGLDSRGAVPAAVRKPTFLF